MRIVSKLLITLMFGMPTAAKAESMEDAARQLAGFYYKGSEAERRINWLIGKVPLQLQLSLTYASTIAQVYSTQMVVFKVDFP